MMAASKKSNSSSSLGILASNGVIMGSDNACGIAASEGSCVDSSFTDQNGRSIANGGFHVTADRRQPLRDRLPSNNRLSSGSCHEQLDLDLRGLSSGYEVDHPVHQEVDELNERIESFDGSSTEHDASAAQFRADVTGGLEESADCSPQSQTNSEGFPGAHMKNRSGQRTKGRPAKASTGATNNRTIIQCPTCRKTFNNSSALAKHKLIHSDERKYTCTLCSKAFKRQDHLNGHMMTHCSKKPYECKFIGCDKSYCDARSLRRHHENHHQQLLDSSMATGSDCSLTPGLTPGPNSLTPGLTPGANSGDSQSGVFSFDFAAPQFLSQEQGGYVLRGDIGGSPSNDLSPLSPSGGVNISPSSGSMSQKAAAWTSGCNPLDEPKPVQCTVCDRRFRNMPALNGHMRLHGGYPAPKKEMDKTEESGNSSEKVASAAEAELLSTVGISCSKMSKASSCSALSVGEPALSSRDAVAPKREDDFANIFSSSKMEPNTLVMNLLHTVTGNQLSGTIDFLQSLDQPNQLDNFNFETQELPSQQMMDQTQDLVGESRLVDEVQSLNQNNDILSSVDHGWTNQQPFGHMTPSGGQLLKGIASKQNFGAVDQMTVISGQMKRLMQLSITMPSQPKQQTNHVGETSIGYNSHPVSGSVSETNTSGHISLDSPSCNSPATPTPLAVGSKNLQQHVGSNHQPLMASYAVSHAPQQMLRRSISTVYGGVQAPRAPLSPFPGKSVYPQLSGQSQGTGSPSTCFPFPSKPSHPATPNLSGYGICLPHTPHTPCSPYTAKPNTPYTPSASSLPLHFQFPPVSKLPESSSSAGSPYPQHHQKSYHPYSRPVPMSPRFLHPASLQQPKQLDELQHHEDFKQVEQKIDEHVQLLHQEDLKKQQQQQMSLQSQNCIMGTEQKDFAHLQSMFRNQILESQADELTSSIDMQELLDDIDQGSNEFEVDMEISSVCPVLESLNAINANELSVLLGDKPSDIQPILSLSANDVGQDMPMDEVIQLFQDDFTAVISNADLGLAPDHGSITQPAISMPTFAPRNCGDDVSGGLLFDMAMTSAETQLSVVSQGFGQNPAAGGKDRQVGTTSCTPKKAKKHRPEPLHIPSNVNSYGFPSQLRSPRLRDLTRKNAMPYTPPPMISPARRGSGVFWTLSNCVVPQSAPPCSRVSEAHCTFDVSVAPEENNAPPETDILPHVNIGPEFQADIPTVVPGTGTIEEKPVEVKEELMWDPRTMDGLTEDELRQYQEFMCCASIVGNGTNKEEALRLLQLCKGSTKMAILKLMTGELNRRSETSNGDSEFKCNDSDSWKIDEITKYHKALLLRDKDFTEIAKEVGTKTVKQCVQFYYIWKKICRDDYRELCRKRSQILGDSCLHLADSPLNAMVLDTSPGHRSIEHQVGSRC